MSVSEVLVRETAAPWYIRQAEFDGIAIVLCGPEPSGRHGLGADVYIASAGTLPWQACIRCEHLHKGTGMITRAYTGHSLEEAEAAYAELEQQLLAGTLGETMSARTAR